jgi:hypothetical protein
VSVFMRESDTGAGGGGGRALLNKVLVLLLLESCGQHAVSGRGGVSGLDSYSSGSAVNRPVAPGI